MASLKHQVLPYPGQSVRVTRESLESTVRELRKPPAGFSAGLDDEKAQTWTFFEELERRKDYSLMQRQD